MMPPYAMPATDEEPPEEGTAVTSGDPLAAGADKASEDSIVEAMRTVYDPEIPVNIYDLGLIYDLEQDDSGDVGIVMTLTAPACPVAGILPGQVADTVAAVEGVGQATVTITWDPPWTPEHMSEAAKVALDMY